MQFTYDAYRQLLDLLQSHGYKCASYHNWHSHFRCVILRHDIDYDISHALELAKVEADARWKTTYFVLLRADAYNPLSYKNMEILKRIMGYGHEIALHFDEMSYSEAMGKVGKIRQRILDEAAVLGQMLGESVTCVSMHRPSKAILDADLQIPGMVNSYGQTFFHDFKYISDSRRHWREPVEEIIKGEKYDRLHILTHAFWYNDTEKDMKSSLFDFVNQANCERYLMLKDNFTALEEVLEMQDVIDARESGGDS